MKTVPMKRVTIVGDNALARQIVREVHELGATGYTYTVVHGEGAKGARPSHWDGPNPRSRSLPPLTLPSAFLSMWLKRTSSSMVLLPSLMMSRFYEAKSLALEA